MFSYSDRTLLFHIYKRRVNSYCFSFQIKVLGVREARRVIDKPLFDRIPRPGTVLGAVKSIKHNHNFTLSLRWENHQLLYSGDIQVKYERFEGCHSREHCISRIE